MPDTVTLRDRDGNAYGVPQEQVAAYVAQGFRPESGEEHVDRAAADTFHEQYGGAAGAIGSGLIGGLSGLTLGTSDLALGALGGSRSLRHLEGEHPYATGVGTLIGAVLPTVLTGGAAAPEEAASIGARILAHSPAGLVSRAGGAIGGLGEGAGLAGRVVAGTAGAAAEGALYGGGQYLTETALEDKPLSAEGFVGGMGHGALFAAPIGAAGTLASGVLTKARSLFPRSEVSAAAAAGVKQEASGALAQAVRDGDSMAAAAERKLSDVEAKMQTAQAGETVTRRVFGEAHPQALGDQVTGAVDRQQVAQALDGYQQARQQFNEWIAAEADPELERALSGLQPGEVQTPFGEPLVPVGEFGAPGARAIKTPEELQRIAAGSAGDAVAPALETPATAVLRGGAKGTPVEPGGVPAQEIVRRGMASPDATTQLDLADTGLRFEPGSRTYHPTTGEVTGPPPVGEMGLGLAPRIEPADVTTVRDRVPGYDDIKAHEAKADDYLERTVPARAIAERGYYEPPGGGVDAVRVENARRAITEGQRDPIKLTVSRDGKILVTDGRHRLAAAIEEDAPIKVKWSTGSEPAPSDVFKGKPPAAATDTLTGLLRGTQQRLEAGEALPAVGRESAAASRAEQGARADAAAAHFRAKAIDKNYAGSAMAAEERAAQAERVGRRAGVGEAASRYRAVRAEPVPSADPLAAFGLESDPTRLGAATGEVPSEVRAMLLPERTAVDTGIKARMGAVHEEAQIAKAIMRHNGKNVDIGPNLARGAKVIGDMEEASAKLTDVLGSEAPATAVERAKDYRTAVGRGQERSAASSAKAAADLTSKVKPAADATVVDDDVARALRKHESRATASTTAGGQTWQQFQAERMGAYMQSEGGHAGAMKRLAREWEDAKAGRAVPGAAATGGSGVGGKLADVGSALEILRALGAHVPALSHIPIIGPVLGLWLKARAVMGILGRKGGSIGKSTESVIAGTAAATRDRIVAATGAMLEGGARGASKASHLGGPALLLAGKLFPGGDKPASDSPRDLFEARSSEITRAMQPGAIDQAIAQRYPTSDPELHDAIVAQVQRGIAFLDTKRPKQTVLPGVLPGDGTWQASKAAIEEFGKYVHAVNDPVSVIEDLAKGHAYPEGAETLRTVYPQLYQYAQKELLKAAPEMAVTLPYARRAMISILYQIPVDGTMHPSHAQYLQVPALPMPPPKPQVTSGPLRLGQQTMTPLDQRAGA